MPTEIRLFAALREDLGPSLQLELAPGATAGEVLEQLATAYPDQGPRFRRARLAADEEFLAASAPVPAGAQLAVIPPVSGG